MINKIKATKSEKIIFGFLSGPEENIKLKEENMGQELLALIEIIQKIG